MIRNVHTVTSSPRLCDTIVQTYPKPEEQSNKFSMNVKHEEHFGISFYQFLKIELNSHASSISPSVWLAVSLYISVPLYFTLNHNPCFFNKLFLIIKF